MLGRLTAFLCLLTLAVGGLPLLASAQPAPSDSVLNQKRDVETVVLEGSQFPTWSAGPEVTFREPTTTLNTDCPNDADGLNHNCSQKPLISNTNNPDAQQPTIPIPNPRTGADVKKLIGYRWDAETKSYVQIPFQLDERFTRYISNLASNCTQAGPLCVGFGQYAGGDQQLSYVYDRDIYKYTAGRCDALPTAGAEQDPIKGLDDNDEMAFMYKDTGTQAPANATPPTDVALQEVRIDDPSAPGSVPRFAYVGLSSGSAAPAFNADNGYMRYVRDADSFHYESTSGNYGNAPKGPVCTADGTVSQTNVPRRPKDSAWILTPRYAFRYAARWSLEGVRVNPDKNATKPLASPDDYGAPLLDQWKARAYAQTPSDKTPCCGFETEEGWQRSSVTVGEKAGPVRVIRSTQGSDSGTNTFRTEIFSPDTIQQFAYLRVHPIPPLGGIFSYWDQHSGPHQKYFNPERPDGVAVDGVNDEVVGTGYVALHSGGIELRDDDPMFKDHPVQLGSQSGCATECTTLDVTDPTLNATGSLDWEEFGSARGSMVFRTGLNITKDQVSPGDVQGLLSIPYYRDDKNFDDGTGTRDASGALTDRGLYGAHGVQLLVTPESDNGGFAGTVPITEVDAQTRIVVLPPPALDANGDPTSVGAMYGHSSDLPLEATTGAPVTDATSIALDGATHGKIGDRVTLSATVTDQLGLPVPNAPVTFTFQGLSNTVTADVQGHAVLPNVLVRGPAGPTDVTATYDGDTIHSASEADGRFTVEKKSSSLSIDPSSATTGQVNHAVTFAAKLADPAAVPGATLHFAFQGSTYDATTGAAGVATTSPITVNGPAGDAPLHVTFDGDDTHDASATDTTIAVTKDASGLAFTDGSDTTAKINHTAHFAAKLSDSAGGVSGATVHLTFQGTTYDATTDANGVAVKDVTAKAPAGDATLTATFDGDDSHPSATASRTIPVSKDDSALAFTSDSDTTGKINQTAHLRAKLTDSSGAVSGATVHFGFQGSTYDATTDESGVASKGVTVKGPVGDTTVTATFDGDGSRTTSSASETFTVATDDSDLQFTGDSASSGKIGDPAHFSVVLADSSGPVSGATVRFTFQGATYDATTNGDGVASVDPSVKGPAGDTTVTATFDGDATRGGSSASTPFTATKRNSKISFTAKSGAHGTVMVNVTLSDPDASHGLASESVGVFVNNAQKAAITTDAKGNGKATFRFAKPNGKTFRVTFAGDDTYAGSSAQAKFGKKGASGSS